MDKLFIGLCIWLVALIELIILAICAGIISGCTKNDIGHYYTVVGEYRLEAKKEIEIKIDGKFSNKDKESIDDAVRNWNYSLNGQIKLKVVDYNYDVKKEVYMDEWLIVKLHSSDKKIPFDKKENVVGFANKIGGNFIYVIRDKLFDVEVMGLVMHEMGHLLGSGHTGVKLMYKTFYRNRCQCVDYESMKEVAKYNELDMEKMNWCFDYYHSLTTKH